MKKKSHSGFTLVELLVVLTIISLLAATILFGISGVQTTARTQRTKAQIARIHELLAERWESYENRRISIPPGAGVTASWTVPNPRIDRLVGLRELVRLELPDRISDVDVGLALNQVSLLPVSGIARPTLNAYYFAVADQSDGVMDLSLIHI